jgi:hypothetical protein
LFYLFADRLGIPAPLAGEVHVPCTTNRARPYDLAGWLFAVTLRGLQEQGVIALSLQPQRVAYFFRTEQVVVDTLPDANFSPSGLAQQMLAIIKRLGAETPVRQVVRAWYGRDVFMAGIVAVKAIKDAGVRLGLIDYVAPGMRLGAVLRGQLPYMLRCERTGPLLPSFGAPFHRWRAFRMGNPRLVERLLGACVGAVYSREEHWGAR